MKSPFTGGPAKLEKEERTLEFRKDQFDILYHFYVCEQSSEKFTDSELDNLNVTQVHNKYREKYGVPFTDEIKNIREEYGLTAAKMSEVLGLGVNVYRNYEAGEVPSVSTGRLIRLAQNPDEFARLLEMSRNLLEQTEYDRVKKKIEHAKTGWVKFDCMVNEWLFGNMFPNIYNGYRVPSVEKVGAMVRYFAVHNKPFTTALNKLMFYADFCHYRKHAQSISGIYYKALPKGPVPENYGTLYNQVVNKSFVKVQPVEFERFVGEQFISDGAGEFKGGYNSFSETELEVMTLVSKKFKGLNTREIVDISHEEPAWKENVDEYNRINFDYAFSLKNIG